jgi:phosphopantothenate---cysteine ligase (ATP)
LDLLEIDEPPEGSTAPPSISVTAYKRDSLLEVLKTYKSVQKAGTMLTLTFVTVNDYLWLLRAVSQELSVLGKDAMYYLAAAVSDFFLPRQKMVFASPWFCLGVLTFAQSVHKIQSGKGSLHIEMDQVPKILKPMVAEWTRQGFVVSFKVSVPREIATFIAE